MLQLLFAAELAKGLDCQREAAACASLVEEEDPVVLEGPLDPARISRRPWGSESWATLQIQEVR